MPHFDKKRNLKNPAIDIFCFSLFSLIANAILLIVGLQTECWTNNNNKKLFFWTGSLFRLIIFTFSKLNHWKNTSD